MEASASSNATVIYQFKIALQFIKPPIWRRIEVPESYTFFDLHVAIQDIFKWNGDHLHKFQREFSKRERDEKVIRSMLTGNFEQDEYIGIPHRAFVNDYKILPEKLTKIADKFGLTDSNKTSKYSYVYDFGSEWGHDVILENISVAIPNVKYPRCTAGRRQPPPEDCPPYEEQGEQLPFSITDITFRDPEVVWKANPFKRF